MGDYQARFCERLGVNLAKRSHERQRVNSPCLLDFKPCTPREVGRLYGNYFISRKLWEVNKSSLKLVNDFHPAFHRNEKRDHPKPAGRMVENRMGDSERIAEKYPAIE